MPGDQDLAMPACAVPVLGEISAGRHLHQAHMCYVRDTLGGCQLVSQQVLCMPALAAAGYRD